MTTNKGQPAGIVKRILAIVYDVLIIFFLIIIISLVVQQLIIQLELVSLEQVQITKEGEMVNVIPADSPVSIFLKSLWLFISLFFYGYYWTKRGQTPGMKVWKIKAISNISNNSASITWSQSIKRFIFALFGLGLIWMFFDKNKLALQDKMSNSITIKL